MHASMHIITVDKELTVNFEILAFQEFISQSYYVNVVLLTCAVARRISVCLQSCMRGICKSWVGLSVLLKKSHVALI